MIVIPSSLIRRQPKTQKKRTHKKNGRRCCCCPRPWGIAGSDASNKQKKKRSIPSDSLSPSRRWCFFLHFFSFFLCAATPTLTDAAAPWLVFVGAGVFLFFLNIFHHHARSPHPITVSKNGGPFDWRNRSPQRRQVTSSATLPSAVQIFFSNFFLNFTATFAFEVSSDFHHHHHSSKKKRRKISSNDGTVSHDRLIQIDRKKGTTFASVERSSSPPCSFFCCFSSIFVPHPSQLKCDLFFFFVVVAVVVRKKKDAAHHRWDPYRQAEVVTHDDLIVHSRSSSRRSKICSKICRRHTHTHTHSRATKARRPKIATETRWKINKKKKNKKNKNHSIAMEHNTVQSCRSQSTRRNRATLDVSDGENKHQPTAVQRTKKKTTTTKIWSRSTKKKWRDATNRTSRWDARLYGRFFFFFTSRQRSPHNFGNQFPVETRLLLFVAFHNS